MPLIYANELWCKIDYNYVTIPMRGKGLQSEMLLN